jgi:hypothetical protein
MQIERVPHPYIVVSGGSSYLSGFTLFRMPARGRAFMERANRFWGTEEEATSALILLMELNEQNDRSWRPPLSYGYFWLSGEPGDFSCGFLRTNAPRLPYGAVHFNYGWTKRFQPLHRTEYVQETRPLAYHYRWDRRDSFLRPELLPPARLLTELLSSGDL